MTLLQFLFRGLFQYKLYDIQATANNGSSLSVTLFDTLLFHQYSVLQSRFQQVTTIPAIKKFFTVHVAIIITHCWNILSQFSQLARSKPMSLKSILILFVYLSLVSSTFVTKMFADSLFSCVLYVLLS